MSYGNGYDADAAAAAAADDDDDEKGFTMDITADYLAALRMEFQYSCCN